MGESPKEDRVCLGIKKKINQRGKHSNLKLRIYKCNHKVDVVIKLIYYLLIFFTGESNGD